MDAANSPPAPAPQEIPGAYIPALSSTLAYFLTPEALQANAEWAWKSENPDNEEEEYYQPLESAECLPSTDPPRLPNLLFFR